MKILHRLERWLYQYPIPEGFHRPDAPQFIKRLVGRWSWYQVERTMPLTPAEWQAFIRAMQELSLSAQQAADAFTECGAAIGQLQKTIVLFQRTQKGEA